MKRDNDKFFTWGLVIGLAFGILSWVSWKGFLGSFMRNVTTELFATALVLGIGSIAFILKRRFKI